MSQYESFKEKILRKTGINLSLYKEKQMKRRIESLASRNGYSDLNLYFAAIDKDVELFKEFINYMTINVSEFYRNPEQWKIVENEIFPALIKKKVILKFGVLLALQVRSHIQLQWYSASICLYLKLVL